MPSYSCLCSSGNRHCCNLKPFFHAFSQHSVYVAVRSALWTFIDILEEHDMDNYLKVSSLILPLEVHKRKAFGFTSSKIEDQ